MLTSVTLQSACCTSCDAIGHAAATVANGESDIAICGGTEAPIFYHPMLEPKMAELCALNFSNKPRAIAHTSTLVNAHGVGDVNDTLILERC